MPMSLHRPSAAGGYLHPGGATPGRAARPSADIQLQLPCDTEAPAAVRDVLRGLHSVGWMIGDAMLVASELVTNAVVHSGAAPEDLLAIHVKLGTDRMLISVRDPGISGRIAKPRPNDDQFGGLGLRLVAELSQRWGTERRRGQRVWAELAVPDQQSAPPSDGAPAPQSVRAQGPQSDGARASAPGKARAPQPGRPGTPPPDTAPGGAHLAGANP